MFTSVPKGLKPGSRGFASVAYTQGMPANYVDLCESLSGYVHVFGPEDQRYSLNPEAFSHLIANVGGRTFSIISRVASCGLDYTGRTNKFAHHIMLFPEERPSHCGPALALNGTKVFYEKWDSEPDFLSPNRVVLDDFEIDDVRARSWEKVFGDAGYAGLLAQAFIDNPDRPSFIVYEPGINILPLMAEAQALLPVNRRWELTFTTYFMALPVGMKCSWRGCLANSDALVVARRTPNALVLDLTKQSCSIGNVPVTEIDSTSKLIELARTGRVKKEEATPPTIVQQKPIDLVTPPPPQPKDKATQRKKQGPIKIDYGKVNAKEAKRPIGPPQKQVSPILLTVAILIVLVGVAGVAFWYLEHRNPSAEISNTAPVQKHENRQQVMAQEGQSSIESTTSNEETAVVPDDGSISPIKPDKATVDDVVATPTAVIPEVKRRIQYGLSDARGELIAYYERDKVFGKSDLIQVESPEGGTLFRVGSDNRVVVRLNRAGVWESPTLDAWAIELRNNDEQVMHVLRANELKVTPCADELEGCYIIALQTGNDYWEAMSFYLGSISPGRLSVTIQRNREMDNQDIVYSENGGIGQFRLQVSSGEMSRDNSDIQKQLTRVREINSQIESYSAITTRYFQIKDDRSKVQESHGVAEKIKDETEKYNKKKEVMHQYLTLANELKNITDKVKVTQGIFSKDVLDNLSQFRASISQVEGKKPRIDLDSMDREMTSLFTKADTVLMQHISREVENSVRSKATAEQILEMTKRNQALQEIRILLDSQVIILGKP